MRLRTGRRNGHNLYAQFGDEPSNDDLSIGYIADPELAAWIVEEVARPGGSERRLRAIVIEGREDWRSA